MGEPHNAQTGPTPPCPARLIGRDREWAAVTGGLQRVLAGQGTLFVLVGEAGIGKTALMRAAADWAAAAGVQVLRGSHSPHPLAPPLDGLRQAVGQLFDLEPLMALDEVKARVYDKLASAWPGLQLHRQLLVQFLSATAAAGGARDRDDRQRQTRFCHVIASLLAAASRSRPLLVSLDDVHWADAFSVDVLAYLAPLLGRERAAVVAAYRPEDAGPRAAPLAGLRARVGTQAVVLGRLDLAGVARMAAAAGLGADRSFCEQLHRRSEGVPLFAEQWLLACRSDAGAGATHSLDQLPAEVSQLLARRLAGLSKDELLVARAAAISGELFDLRTLSGALELPLQELLSTAAGLEETWGLIQAVGAGEFAFRHNLIRQALDDGMPAVLRQDLHRRLADALEPTVERHPERTLRVAEHCLAGQMQPRAANLLLRAARHAYALQAYESARQYLQAAQAAHSDDPQTYCQVEELLGDTAEALGDTNAARAHWEAALGEQEDPAWSAGLCRKIGRAYRRDPLEQRRWYHQSLQHAPPGSPERAHALYLLACNPAPDARDDAERQAEAARQMGEALRIMRHRPDHPLLGHLLASRTPQIRDWRSTNLPRIRRLLRRAARLAEAREDWGAVAEITLRLGGSYRGADLEAALRYGEEALRLALRYSAPDSPPVVATQSICAQWRLALGDQKGDPAGDNVASDFPVALAGGSQTSHQLAWRTHPQQAWDELTKVLAARLRPSGAEIAGRTLGRLQRLAAQTGRQAAWGNLMGRLREEHAEDLRQTGLRIVDLTPACGPPPEPPDATECRGIAELVWRDGSRASHHRSLDADQVEIVPAPEVGLGWINCAPCLLATVAGDFALQVRIDADSAPRRAGGLVLFQDRRILLRFASGVDHAGQVSLGWHDGVQLRYAGMVYLPHRAIHLRLSRAGTRVEAHFSPDGHAWYTCGSVDFGHPGPVEAGLFAECNYEYDFPQPFPVRFSGFARRSAPNATSADAPTPTHVRPRLYPLRDAERWHGMVGQSRSFRAFGSRLEQVATSPFTVLLCGETGVGKDLAARALHQLSGRRGRFVPVNVAALPSALIESELFGHQRGAFSGATHDRDGFFQLADRGTLFLDEIGELPTTTQATLHRALDTGEVQRVGGGVPSHVDVRCVAATARDLARAVEQGGFRKDLYFRLGQPLEVPPLRQRREDIPLLVAAILRDDGQRHGSGITRAAMERLQDYDWPGNVRELQNVLRGALATVGTGVIDAADLALDSLRRPASGPRPAAAQPTADELRQLLAEHGDNIAAVSRRLGVNRRTVYRWLERDKMSPRKRQGGPED